MARRALTVWVDCEDKNCDECSLYEPIGGRMYCMAFDKWLVDEKQPPQRCPECLDAESKAFAVAGVARAELPTLPDTRIAPPKRDSSGGYEVPR